MIHVSDCKSVMGTARAFAEISLIFQTALSMSSQHFKTNLVHFKTRPLNRRDWNRV